MRLKALLIDDEMHILRNLQQVLPWQDMEIEVSALARNGAEALEAVREHSPDLILCDIRMPVMDGIQFLHGLKDSGSDPQVVMLTGYQDFEYARSVMRLGVSDYILKPIDYEELKAVIERLAAKIRTRLREKSSEEQRLGEAIALAHEKLLYDLLMDYASVDAGPLLQAQANAPERVRYSMLLADFDHYAHRFRETGKQERKLWNFAVRNVLTETLSAEGLRHAVLQTREGEWCVLVQRGETAGAGEDELHGLAYRLQESVMTHVGIGLSLGFHCGNLALDELAGAFKTLQRNVHLAADKHRSILICTESESQESRRRQQLWEPIEALVSALKHCDRNGIDEALRQLNDLFHAISGTSLARAEKLAHFLALHLLREMRELGVLSAEQEQDIWTMMEQADRVKELFAVVRRIVDVSLVTALGKKSGDVLMHAAGDYMHRHLSRDLGIDEVAGHLGISPSYFSLLFKQHYGCTFVEYVTSERVEMAKSLLRMTDKSVTEIGRSVGYAERRYFTKVFQKLTGQIPSEFRENTR